MANQCCRPRLVKTCGTAAPGATAWSGSSPTRPTAIDSNTCAKLWESTDGSLKEQKAAAPVAAPQEHCPAFSRTYPVHPLHPDLPEGSPQRRAWAQGAGLSSDRPRAWQARQTCPPGLLRAPVGLQYVLPFPFRYLDNRGGCVSTRGGRALAAALGFRFIFFFFFFTTRVTQAGPPIPLPMGRQGMPTECMRMGKHG